VQLGKKFLRRKLKSNFCHARHANNEDERNVRKNTRRRRRRRKRIAGTYTCNLI
jgi:hypothetical protein